MGVAASVLAVGSAAAAPEQPKQESTPITAAKAESIALARVPGGVVEQLERDHHMGKLVWDVEVRAPDGREHELAIDATDGKVLSEEIDRD